jgi:hypothetical protein
MTQISPGRRSRVVDQVARTQLAATGIVIALGHNGMQMSSVEGNRSF